MMPLPLRTMALLLHGPIMRAVAIAGALAIATTAAASSLATAALLFQWITHGHIEHWMLAGAALSIALLAWPILAGLCKRLKALVQHAHAIDVATKRSPSTVVPFRKRGHS